MAIRSKEDILETIKTRIGDDTSDETLSFLEDITDTMNDYEERLSGETDWKNKFEENDKEWRKKYAERFFGKEPEEETEDIEEEKEEKEVKTYADLFKEE